MWFFIILGVLVSLDIALFIIYKVIKKKREKEVEDNESEVIENDKS